MSDQSIQLPSEGSGKKLKTLQLTVVNPLDGTLTTVQMQVLTIADERGYPLQVIDHDWHAKVLEELKMIRMCLGRGFKDEVALIE